jgi:indoleacetamide hydrolase
MDPTDLTVTEARAAMVRGELSSTDYVQALLARCDAAQAVNAWVTRDPDALRRAAAQADASGATRDASRPLAGIPIALKDNIDTVALPTSGATPALMGRTPPADAPVARALFDAGALLAGKANMHELAFGITCHNACTGAVRNPWDLRMIPGGSSGGSAAAVAARMVPAALGTDTGASVRLPAALCGVVGFRPTVGRYPGQGIVPISHTRDTAGPITRSVADAVLLDGLLADLPGDAAAPLAPATLRGLRLGVPRADFYGGLDPQVEAVIGEALRRMAALGVELIEADVPGLAALNEAVGFPVALYELTQDLPAYLAAAGHGLTLADVAARIASPDVAGIVGSQLGAQAVPRAAYEAALRTRVHLQAAYAEYFARHRLDAMVFPTAILPARPIGDDETVLLNGERVPTFPTFIRNTDAGSNAGIPGISLPAGLTAEGLPVGLELDGPVGSDRHLLAVAAAVEAVLPRLPAPTGWQRPPAG